ncbi:cation-translocating P-type ATPase [Actinopolymorpha pittospori]
MRSPSERINGAVSALPSLVTRVVPTGGFLPSMPLRRGRMPRRWWVGRGHAHIEVRGADRPRAGRLVADVETALLALSGVRRAEVNGILGRVFVEYDEDELEPDDFLLVVDAIEKRHGLEDQPFPVDRPSHPGDPEPRQRQLVALGAGVAALGFSAVGRVFHLGRLPAEVNAVVGLVDSTPRLRRAGERLLGRAAADLTLGVANAAAQGLGHGQLGLLVDASSRVLLAREAAARERAWKERETQLCSGPAHGRVPALDLPPRPAPLPPGPIEKYGDLVGGSAVLATGAALAATRNIRRSFAMLAAGTPKAGRMAREGFAAELGRTLSSRGVVALDIGALRRLDRVDTVVIDARVLLTGRFVIGRLTTLNGVGTSNGKPAGRGTGRAMVADEGRLRLKADSLLDPEEPHEVRRQREWTLGPFTQVVGEPSPQARAAAGELAGRGTVVLGLLRQGQLLAVLAAEPERAPLTDALVTAASEVGEVVLAGRGSEITARIATERTLPGGSHLPAAIRELQAEGRVVALVAEGPGTALAAADCGIGILRPGRRTPWAAHLLCGPELTEVRFLLDGAAAAKAVSRRGALLSAYGSVTAALLALMGPPRGSTARALVGVNLAAGAGLATGAWTAHALARRPEPIRTDANHWHAQKAETVLERLRSDPDGLTAAEARARLAAMPPDGRQRAPGFVRAVVDELANPLTPTLAAGGGVAAASGSPSDAVLIGTVMALNAVIGGAQRIGTERAVRRLADVSAARVRVRRDGTEGEVTADTLVPGDVIVLQAGDAVPADARILDASGLEIDESSLTGESQLVGKSAEPSGAAHVADRTSMVYDGTDVAAGRVSAVVVAAGPETEAGRGMRAMVGPTPSGGVEARLGGLVRATIPVALGSGAALVAAGLLRRLPLRDTLGPAVSLAVAAVPEGLPVVATVAQLASARRLSNRNALVRHPPTVETIGRVTTLLIDKTGTLTEGSIHLKRISDGMFNEPTDRLSETCASVLAAGLRASPEHVAGEVPPHPTDRAVVAAAERVGVRSSTGAPDWALVDDVPFESGRGYHAALGRTSNGQRLVVKGAPEIVLPKCIGWRRGNDVQTLDEPDRAKVETEIQRLAGQGYRVLAVAERGASSRQDLTEDRVERLEFLGLLAFADEVRPTSAQAVSTLRRAGVEVVMLTGDHPTTAQSIADELGILDGQRVLTGAEMDEMDDAALSAALPGVSVLARVTPAQKVRVVQGYQETGRTVAMVGDGTNDAPAIRVADVGVALGRHGTNAAREASDLVVTDDRLETITDAMVEGRAMWASVRDAVALLVGGNLGEIVFTLGAGLLSPGGSPLNARQLLLVNLFTDILPAMALAIRPPARVTPEDLLHEGPDASLGVSLTRDVLVRAGATAASATGAWVVGRMTGTPERASTVALVALVGAQLGQTVVAGWRSPLVVGASAASGLALGTVVQVPGLSQFFGCRPLGPVGWGTALTAAAAGTAASVALPRAGELVRGVRALGARAGGLGLPL